MTILILKKVELCSWLLLLLSKSDSRNVSKMAVSATIFGYNEMPWRNFNSSFLN